MLIVDMPMPKVCITKDGYYGNCPMDRVWCAQRNAPSGTIMRDVYAEMTDNIPSWCPIKCELVRCGECYYKNEKRIMDEDALWCGKHHMYVTADWFCADRARKENNNE